MSTAGQSRLGGEARRVPASYRPPPPNNPRYAQMLEQIRNELAELVKELEKLK